MIEELYKEINSVQIVSFDIFDTLITRYVLKPTDVFKIVEVRVNKEYGYSRCFYQDRICAEKNCYKLYKHAVSLEKIYSELKKAGYSDAECLAFKKCEIDTEFNIVIPRKDILDLFLKLYKQGKKLILCSDMYLSSDIIQNLLIKCGYPNNLEIIVSNEIGFSKWDGSLWQYLIIKYSGYKILHIGDNKNSDKLQVEKLGHKAFLIDNPLDKFTQSSYYEYLSKYIDKGIGNSLVLGCFVNNVLFNSSFGKKATLEELSAIWMGPVLGSFTEWLVDNKDDSHLLFLTREGFILKPLYDKFCSILEIKPQKNTLFYASRSATGAASVTSQKELEDIFNIEFNGSFRKLIKFRLNYLLPEDNRYDVLVRLPKDKKFALKEIAPFCEEIFKYNIEQSKAYKQYFSDISSNDKKFTVVDIGYRGTIQYNLSKILGELISGRYMFLNRNPLPKKLGCICKGMRYTAHGNQPIFENLLFLEGILQVPYGQLQRVDFDYKGKVIFHFNDDDKVSVELKIAQESISNFVYWEASWKKKLGLKYMLNFDLAQVIWICMLKFNDLPSRLIDSFGLVDDFTGNSEWHYDFKAQKWKSENNEFPLNLSLVSDNTSEFIKNRIKVTVKKYIPNYLYTFARHVWINYLK